MSLSNAIAGGGNCIFYAVNPYGYEDETQSNTYSFPLPLTPRRPKVTAY